MIPHRPGTLEPSEPYPHGTVVHGLRYKYDGWHHILSMVSPFEQKRVRHTCSTGVERVSREEDPPPPPLAETVPCEAEVRSDYSLGQGRGKRKEKVKKE